LLRRSAPCMVIQGCSALIKASRVPGIAKSQPLTIQVVTELMAQCAQECSKRGDLLANRRFHPHADEHRIGAIVAEKLRGRIFPYAQRSGCQYPDFAARHFVKI